jgi:hypothetical protein
MHYTAKSRAERHERRKQWSAGLRRSMRARGRTTGAAQKHHELAHQQERMEAVLGG